MALSVGLGMRQNLAMRQEMVMTPQMIQSMEMLQLPIMALEQRIQQELLTNPALEILELEDDQGDGARHNSSEAHHTNGLAKTSDQKDFEQEYHKGEYARDQFDYSWDDFDEPAPRMSRYRGGDGEDDKLDALYNTPDRPESLQAHLAEQIGYLDLGARERALAERVIYQLDNAGYLRIPLEELINAEEEDPPSPDELAAALHTVQGLEPAGVGARSAKECLLLQIARLGKYHEFEYGMVKDHLEALAANRLPHVAKAMDCSLDEVKAVLDFLRTLNPQPGLDYGPQEELRVVPDVAILFEQDAGELVVRLNRGNLPELRISAGCQEAYESEERNSEARKVLREQITNADWIIRAIEQRNRTLLRVSYEIVKHQRDYLLGQNEQPGPLMMQEVADTLEIDISTVSRAVRDKYADTPRGLVALRDMFTRQVGGGENGEEGNSNVQIMERIRHMIEGEDPKKPLKDAQIVRLLKAEGIDIVRRTVAKYRQNLGIPNYSQRRQY